MKNIFTTIFYLVFVFFIVSCDNQNSADIADLPELPAEMAAQLELSISDPVVMTHALVLLSETQKDLPTTANRNRAQQCSWDYLSQVNYPIVRCYPQNSLTSALKLTAETQHYKLNHFQGQQLASPYLCSVQVGPWASQVTEAESCNANVPNAFSLRAATPKVELSWFGNWENAPRHDSLNIVVDELYILREGCACCEGFRWCPNTGTCVDSSLDCNSLARQ